MKKELFVTVLLFSMLISGCDQKPQLTDQDVAYWNQASKNGLLYNEGIERCRKFVEGWLSFADPETGLIPRNLRESREIWNAQDAAADNYPFMVLTTVIADSLRFMKVMTDMLETEQRITSRIGHLPDTYNFSKKGFDKDTIVLPDIIFGSSEYIKDGLLPLTEWLGQSPWSDRMLDILDDIWANALVETVYGNIPSDNVEVNGEMLQVLSRIYFMTGDQKYMDWAIRLGDYYLLGDHHPTRNFETLRLRDHGCEIVSGLCELYALLHYKSPEKKAIYQPHLYEMLDRILEVGRNQDGLFYDVVQPQNGTIIRDRIADNFGYTLNGFYTVYQLDSISTYREALIKALGSLNKRYRNYDWENNSADGYADAIEGALNLFNREPVESTDLWMDSEIKVMWDKQQDNGIIEGWHGDGNFARTTIMYCLWKSKGLTLNPWRSDLAIGAEMVGDTLWISITTDTVWDGEIVFDYPRHQSILHLPHDWPRINQFPEWYTIRAGEKYQILKRQDDRFIDISNNDLTEGLAVNLEKGEHHFKVIKLE